MKIFLIHNYYQQPGGEDSVVEQEKHLLESRGHVVELLTAHNSSISGFKSKIATGFRTIYSVRSRARVETEIAKFKPDVVHIHNFFPQFSPSVYYACKKAQIPVVQTLHNFRLICPNALLFREGSPCEQCVGKFIPLPGIAHACYRNSRSGTAALAAMLTTHRMLHTWNTRVDAYITLSEFARQKFVAGGLPSDRLFVKPNCLTPDPGMRTNPADFALFVGRLSAEKGILTLLTAWRQLQDRKLRIVGDGPLRSAVEGARDGNIEFLGQRSNAEVLALLGKAAFLVVASECYENFPRVIVEAFARGVPVLSSRIGSIKEIVRENYTGMFFAPGDAGDLANRAEWLFKHSGDLDRMSCSARNEFLTKYTADRNYERLIDIYAHAVERSQSTRPGSRALSSTMSHA